jgi:DNA-binding MarR family transcriptional regulator
MDNDAVLLFSDHMGRFYAKQYGFPPVVGRLIGYLSVCEPIQQSIGDIAEALLTSRSAINGAVKMLETQNLITRTRPAGSRADLISVSNEGWEKAGFNPNEYRQQAALAQEGLELLKGASAERRRVLEEFSALNDFLADSMPKLWEEWLIYRNRTLGKKRK